jgi:GntR family transcriptional regulator, N-acetylglucosamine utilization regulator
LPTYRTIQGTGPHLHVLGPLPKPRPPFALLSRLWAGGLVPTLWPRAPAGPKGVCLYDDLAGAILADVVAPLYHVVASDLREKINEGVWPPESRLPNEVELCRRYGVSRITVRHAISILVNEGLVTRNQGLGTFVRRAAITAGLRGLSSFTEEMSALGVKSGGHVLTKKVIAAARDSASALSVTEGTPLLELRRLRTGDEVPIGIQTSYLPLDRFPGLNEQDLENVSLYALLQADYGVLLVEAMETIRIGKAKALDSRLLGVAPSSPVFVVERRTLDRRGPFEYVVSVMRPDRYQVRLRLTSLNNNARQFK